MTKQFKNFCCEIVAPFWKRFAHMYDKIRTSPPSDYYPADAFGCKIKFIVSNSINNFLNYLQNSTNDRNIFVKIMSSQTIFANKLQINLVYLGMIIPGDQIFLYVTIPDDLSTAKGTNILINYLITKYFNRRNI